MDLRFSPRAKRAHLIDWRPWSGATFREAAELDRPVFLSISAVWCHWCHIMDETTFCSAEVTARLNSDFIPIRVDSDRRPDINRRYNLGGWPTVAFLTPDGESMIGGTYVPPRQFLSLMATASQLWADHKGDIRVQAETTKVRTADGEEAPAVRGEVDEGLINQALAHLCAGYDQEFGGIGTGMKFARTDVLAALLARSETNAGEKTSCKMLATTIDAMRTGGLWDPVEYGFFRYATQRDWSQPHYEKMLEDNARLIRLLARAAELLRRPDWYATSNLAQTYLDKHLWQADAEAYGGSQDSDPEYYLLATVDARHRLPAPGVDPNTYTDWNALALRGLLALAASGKPKYARRALTLATTLLGRRTQRGLFLHDPGPDALDILLADQLAMFDAFLDLYGATGEGRWRTEALTIWQTVDRYHTADLGPLLRDIAQPEPSSTQDSRPPDVPEAFTDTPEARIGRLAHPQTPLLENAQAAISLATLSRVSRLPSLRDRALAIVAALASRVDSMGDLAAPVAEAAILILREPVHITIVGRRGAADTIALLLEARQLPGTDKLVELLDPAEDEDLVRRAGLPASHEARAYLCARGRCFEPLTKPEELRPAVLRAVHERE